MADLMELEIVTPERQLVCEAVTEAQIPAEEGYIGILPGHAPLLSMLGSGFLGYKTQAGQRRSLAVHGGFVEVLPDHVRVLANLAEPAEEIDLERARAEAAEANRRLLNQGSGVDPGVALEEAALANARVAAAEQR
jgi:F-type H+-transporting ATPase subunit epsilon